MANLNLFLSGILKSHSITSFGFLAILNAKSCNTISKAIPLG